MASSVGESLFCDVPAIAGCGENHRVGPFLSISASNFPLNDFSGLLFDSLE